jgi:hypothetical protein
MATCASILIGIVTSTIDFGDDLNLSFSLISMILLLLYSALLLVEIYQQFNKKQITNKTNTK